MWDRLFIDVNLATMAGAAPYGAISDGVLATRGGEIAHVGRRADLAGAPEKLAREVVACDGRWLLPGLIDCHSHLVFAGNRAAEFALRLGGASYEAIARAGGGILSTVGATRAASADALLDAALVRLDRSLADGVTTIEIKSGYGLETESEIGMLRVAGRLAGLRPVRVSRSFLGAHALPPEFAGRREAWLDLVCEEMIPRIAAEGLADAVDAFCESIAFTPDEVGRVFEAAAAHGLARRLHAGQLSDLGGAGLAARHGALSVDHLEHVGAADIAAMARAGTVAVLLPGAFYTLRETHLPPVAALRAAGVPMAVASDCNPGSSPLLSPLLVLNMAATLFRLTPQEALAGMTVHAARALGLADRIGALAPGMAADFCLWEIGEPAELAYWIGAPGPVGRWFAGQRAGIAHG